MEWERDYKWGAHKLFQSTLNRELYAGLLRDGDYFSIANRALQVRSRTTFLFSFEKMALRDALRTTSGATTFAQGLYDFLYEPGARKEKFIEWIVTVADLPRVKLRVLSWPILTVFPYLAQPKKHMIMKPSAMRFAADELGYDLDYSSKPTYRTYERLVHLADLTGDAIADSAPERLPRPADLSLGDRLCRVRPSSGGDLIANCQSVPNSMSSMIQEMARIRWVMYDDSARISILQFLFDYFFVDMHDVFTSRIRKQIFITLLERHVGMIRLGEFTLVSSCAR